MKIKFLNEKGNVISTTREEIRNQAIDYLLNNTSFLEGPNGLYKQIAENEDGTPIYAVLNLTISMQNPTIKKPSLKEKKEKHIIPNLFE